MSKVTEFLSKSDEQEIVEAIINAEQNTSGEIRVHLEKSHEKNAYDRSLDVFLELKMDQTKLQNGVLIYIAVEDKKFAICGDKGINDVVPADFWDCTKNSIATQFQNNNFKQGLIDGITTAGIQLKKYFPVQKNDADELSNEISFGQ